MTASAVFLFLLCITVIISLGGLNLAGLGTESDAIKSMEVRVFAIAPIFIAGILLTKRWRSVLVGAAIGLLINGAFSLIQLAAYQIGVFPLRGLYNNTQFTIVADQMTNGLVHQNRVMGLFPEPSALAASSSLLSLLFFSAFCGLITLPPNMSRRYRQLVNLSGLVGVAMILLSKSGQVFPAGLAIGGIAIAGLVKSIRSRTTIFRSSAILFVVLSALLFAAISMASVRLDTGTGEGNSSWAKRVGSILEGATVWTKSPTPTVIFGLGGRANLIISTETDYTTVVSVLATFILDTGIIGIVFWLGIIVYVINQIRRSPLRMLGSFLLLNWFLAVLLTTSYFSLIPLWLSLSVLLEWRRLSQYLVEGHPPVTSPDQLGTLRQAAEQPNILSPG